MLLHKGSQIVSILAVIYHEFSPWLHCLGINYEADRPENIHKVWDELSGIKLGTCIKFTLSRIMMLGQAKSNCLQKATSSVENQLKDPHPIESHTVMVDIILADELELTVLTIYWVPGTLLIVV